MTAGAIHRERLEAQGLTGPPLADPVAVAERLLAIQAQDPRAARLAIRARSEGLTVADVDRALSEERTLVITWLNRGTLHLVRSEDYFWLQELTTPALFTTNATRLRQEDVSPERAERGVEVIERALAEEGPLTRAQLRERLGEAGLPIEGQAFILIVLLASLRGLVVRGPMIGKQHAFVLVRDWLGPPPPVDRDAALANLARRYLAGHGPAGDRDLAKWAGLPLRDVRAGLESISDELERVADGAFRLRGRKSPPPKRTPPPRLLGAFDPTLLGWSSREGIVDAADEARVVNGGLFLPFAMVRGRAAATWRWAGGEVEIEPFAPISGRASAALARDGADVARFLSG